VLVGRKKVEKAGSVGHHVERDGTMDDRIVPFLGGSSPTGSFKLIGYGLRMRDDKVRVEHQH